VLIILVILIGIYIFNSTQYSEIKNDLIGRKLYFFDGSGWDNNTICVSANNIKTIAQIDCKDITNAESNGIKCYKVELGLDPFNPKINFVVYYGDFVELDPSQNKPLLFTSPDLMYDPEESC